MMKLAFEVQELVNGLNKAAKAFPLNGAVRLEIKMLRDGKHVLNIIAYNGVDLQVHTLVGVTVDVLDERVLSLDGKKLVEAVNALRVLGGAMEILVRETDILVQCGDNHITLGLLGEQAKIMSPIEEQPSMVVSLNGEQFGTAISKVAFATMENEAGKDADGVFLEISPSGVTLSATACCSYYGGSTAIKVKTVMASGEKEEEKIQEALKSATRSAYLPRILSSISGYFEEKTTLFFFGNKVVIQSGSDGYFIGIKTATFVKAIVTKVMSEILRKENTRITMKKAALLHSLKIASIGCNVGTKLIPVEVFQNGKSFVFKDTAGQTETKIEINGDETLLSSRYFDPKRMSSCLQGLGEDIVLTFAAEDSPIAGISSPRDPSTQIFLVLCGKPSEEK